MLAAGNKWIFQWCKKKNFNLRCVSLWRCSLRGQSNPKTRSEGHTHVAKMILNTIPPLFSLWLWLRKGITSIKKQKKTNNKQPPPPCSVTRCICWVGRAWPNYQVDSSRRVYSKTLYYRRQILAEVRFACCHSLPVIFRKQTAEVIDLMARLEWKHFWA